MRRAPLDTHAVELLAAVFLGWAIGVGAQPRAVARVIGGKQTAKLIRLLELLEDPDDERARAEKGSDE